MDPITIGIIGSLGASYLANFTSPVIKDFFDKVIKKRPDLEVLLQTANTPQEIERVFSEALGVLDASAGTGSIEVDNALVEAIRGIRFDHSNGTVIINGTRMKAPILVTGGSQGSKGETTIQGTEMESQGTKIVVGGNAQIKITGNAQIKQN
ncbi:MAG: hypothetical protein WBJ37_01480 [Bacteroidales bacterium]